MSIMALTKSVLVHCAYNSVLVHCAYNHVLVHCAYNRVFYRSISIALTTSMPEVTLPNTGCAESENFFLKKNTPLKVCMYAYYCMHASCMYKT